MYGRRKLARVEIAVYAAIIATLVVVFSSYLLDYMEMAEKTAMETTVSSVTAAINLRYATLVMAGERPGAAHWSSANPFELARAFPPNYRGELGAEQRLELDRPAWAFDELRAELVYLPRLHSYLEDGRTDELRFRLEPNPSGFGFHLAPTLPYTWRLAGFAKNS
jgi:hypothetical protein